MELVGRWWVRLTGVLAVLLAAVTAAAATDAAGTAAASAPAPSRIIAIGDLHGDHGAWQDIARAAGLIDPRGHWSGKATTLVLLGDIPDRGPDSLKIIRDVMRLQREAPRKGGRVVALVGNHEAMNIIGDLRYVSPGEIAAFATGKSADLRQQVFRANRTAIEAAYRKTDESLTSEAIRLAWLETRPLGSLEHQAAWSPGGEIGKWVIANPAVLLLDDTLFVHGGISAGYATQTVDQLNRAVAAALTARETAATSIINDPLGPLWYRGLAGMKGEPADNDATPLASAPAQTMPVEEELALVLRSFGAGRLVIGHTPSRSGIRLRHEGRLALIDTGISAAYGGQPSYLEILDGRLVPHDVTRSQPAEKVSR